MVISDDAGPGDSIEWLHWAADTYASAVARGGCYEPEPDWDVEVISPKLREAAAEIERLRARVEVLERACQLIQADPDPSAVVECTGCDKDENGNIIAVHCNYFADSKSGTEGSANYKVKGNIHWVSVSDSLEVEVRLYDRLFTDANPDAGGKDFMALLNPSSLETIRAYVEPGMVNVEPNTRLQFERHGYFVADRVDSVKGKPVFNRVTTLKDSWGK